MENLKTLFKNKIVIFNLQVLKKQILSVLFKILSILLTFVLTKFFISELGFQRYGDYVLINGYLIVVSALTGTGFGMFALKENASIKGFDHVLLLQLTLLVFINIIFFILLFLIINHHYNFCSQKLVYGIVSYSLSAFLIEIVRSKSNGNIYILFKDVSRSVLLLLFVFLIPSRDNVFLINLSSSIALLIILVYLAILFLRHGTDRLSKVFSLKDMYFGSWSIALVAFSQFLKIRLDIFLAGFFFNKSIVGMYDVLMKLGQLIKLPEVALNADIAKQFAVSIKSNRFSKELKNKIKITKFLGYAFGTICIMGASFYLKFYGYDNSFDNIVLAALFWLANTVKWYYGPLGLFVQLSSLKRYFLGVILMSIVLTGLLSYVTVPFIGMFALAATNIVITIIWNHLVHAKIQSTYNFRI